MKVHRSTGRKVLGPLGYARVLCGRSVPKADRTERDLNVTCLACLFQIALHVPLRTVDPDALVYACTAIQSHYGHKHVPARARRIVAGLRKEARKCG